MNAAYVCSIRHDNEVGRVIESSIELRGNSLSTHFYLTLTPEQAAQLASELQVAVTMSQIGPISRFGNAILG